MGGPQGSGVMGFPVMLRYPNRHGEHPKPRPVVSQQGKLLDCLLAWAHASLTISGSRQTLGSLGSRNISLPPVQVISYSGLAILRNKLRLLVVEA